MTKPIIRIIKRKDAEAAANVKTLNSQVPPTEEHGADKIARRLERETAAMISKWITEHRKTRLEETHAVRRFFGNELLLSKISLESC